MASILLSSSGKLFCLVLRFLGLCYFLFFWGGGVKQHFVNEYTNVDILHQSDNNKIQSERCIDYLVKCLYQKLLLKDKFKF